MARSKKIHAVPTYTTSAAGVAGSEVEFVRSTKENAAEIVSGIEDGTLHAVGLDETGTPWFKRVTATRPMIHGVPSDE